MNNLLENYQIVFTKSIKPLQKKELDHMLELDTIQKTRFYMTGNARLYTIKIDNNSNFSEEDLIESLQNHHLNDTEFKLKLNILNKEKIIF